MGPGDKGVRASFPSSAGCSFCFCQVSISDWVRLFLTCSVQCDNVPPAGWGPLEPGTFHLLFKSLSHVAITRGEGDTGR